MRNLLQDCEVECRLVASQLLVILVSPVLSHSTGQWIESVTDWAIRITDWGLFPDWVSSHARLADPIRPMPNKGKSGHSGLPIALISRLPDWVVQSVLPIAIHRLLHRLYPLARCVVFVVENQPPLLVHNFCSCLTLLNGFTFIATFPHSIICVFRG